MKPIYWSADKNQRLISERGVSFEDALFAILSGGLLDDIRHPNRERYPHQRIFVLALDDYAWFVPYVESEEEIFLKTMFPSRKATQQYLRGPDE